MSHYQSWEQCREIFNRYGLALIGYSDGKVFRFRVCDKQHGWIRSQLEDLIISDMLKLSVEELNDLAYFYKLAFTFS
jgi:hypothetical protein